MSIIAGPDRLADKLIASYGADARAVALAPRCLPSPEAIARILQDVLALLFPGYFGRRDLDEQNLATYIASGIADLKPRLEAEIAQCLCHDLQRGAASRGDAVRGAPTGARARALGEEFLGRLPQIRTLLDGDVQAAYEGDPAATSPDEVILAYPGVLAVSVYRIAHALHALGVPLMPRIMTEWAHSHTGCDIHPAADIGPRFFIDHATGVVIGATAVVGARVRLYQGVTLGAISLPRDSTGQFIRAQKRHPTVESGVTIYANATILGGETVIGEGSVIGGSVFITRSVAPRSRVSLKDPDLRVASRDDAQNADVMYFDI
jgi:serine O-acetyltransferase